MTEERKHEIEDIIDNALTEEDCKAWAAGNCTDHVKQLMEEHHIKQMNIWDDVCEIVEFDSQEKTYKYKAYFEGKDCPVAVGTIEAESKEEAEKILFGISGSWTDESGNVFDAGCPVDVKVEAIEQESKIYVSAGCGADFGLKGTQAGMGCLCFEKKQWNDSIKAPSLKYFHNEASEKLKSGKVKRLFLLSYDQGYREFYKEYGNLIN